MTKYEIVIWIGPSGMIFIFVLFCKYVLEGGQTLIQRALLPTCMHAALQKGLPRGAQHAAQRGRSYV